jgi:farnesyl-diphosphate farnesyltransferase
LRPVCRRLRRTEIIALETAAELDDYTYRVAGCVGEFWTKICRAHLFPQARLDERNCSTDGIRFGKGLQLVNILRDLPADLKGPLLSAGGKAGAGGIVAGNRCCRRQTRRNSCRLFHEYLDKAESHLAAGWNYTNTLPFGQFRVRLACAWPVLIGVRTIEKLRAADVMELRQRVKVSRGEVRGIMIRSVLASPLPERGGNCSRHAKAVASGGKLA